MIDGTYSIEAQTPLGAQSGRLTLACSGSSVDAKLNIAGKTTESVGVVQGDSLSFEGEIRLPFPLGKRAYRIDASVVGDKLNGFCDAGALKFDFTGSRVG